MSKTRIAGLTTLAIVVMTCVMIAAGEVDGPKRPHIAGIYGVRIRITDYCRTSTFYKTVFGQTAHPCPQQARTADGATLALWTGQALGVNINSLYGKPPNPPNLVEQVGFLTDDAKALREYLQSRGVSAQELSDRSFLVIDPEGHRVQFLERVLPDEASRPDVAPFRRSRIIHAGWVVKDRAKMDAFYKDILGFRPYWHGGMKDDETSWVSLQVPDGTDWIEYMLNIPENADKHLLGVMNHIALGVPDVRAAAKQLEANGVQLPEQPKIGRDGKWQLNLYDPDDTRVEFMEFMPVEKPCCSEYTGPHPKP